MRTLERQIGAVCRAVAVKVAESSARHKEAPRAEKSDEKSTNQKASDKVVTGDDVVEKVKCAVFTEYLSVCVLHGLLTTNRLEIVT